jgi:hypothetical protein
MPGTAGALRLLAGAGTKASQGDPVISKTAEALGIELADQLPRRWTAAGTATPAGKPRLCRVLGKTGAETRRNP